MTDQQYSAHEWLNKAYWLEKTELKSKVDYAEMCKPDDGAIDYSKIRVQNDSFGAQEERLNTYAMACDVVDKTRARIEKIRQSRQEVIENISSSRQRTLLTYRYLHHHSWKQNSGDMHYGKTQLDRIWKDALDSVYEFIKDEGC
mgnify:FL=1